MVSKYIYMYSGWKRQISHFCMSSRLIRKNFYSEIYIRFVPNIVYKFIYQTLFLFVVNGTWGLWGAWGSCTTTCDDGIWKRYRSCDNPAPAHGGSDCQGSTNATATCYTTCPGTCTVELYLYC